MTPPSEDFRWDVTFLVPTLDDARLDWPGRHRSS